MNLIHGHAHPETATYRCWKAMNTRCTNPKAPYWLIYGGRGIRVCKRWRRFENFLSDMGEKPPGLTLERKNTNGHYGPDNCIWATWRAQRLNQRRGAKMNDDAVADLKRQRSNGASLADLAHTFNITKEYASMLIRDLRGPNARRNRLVAA